ncbi:hypothetical protein ACFX2I_025157 [Malus domestica]
MGRNVGKLMVIEDFYDVVLARPPKSERTAKTTSLSRRLARLLTLLDRRQRTSSLSPVQPNFYSRLPSQFSLLPACPKRTPWPPSLICFVSVTKFTWEGVRKLSNDSRSTLNLLHFLPNRSWDRLLVVVDKSPECGDGGAEGYWIRKCEDVGMVLYVNDGRPFWQYIVSSSTGCSDSQCFEELYNYYTTDKAWHLCDPDAEKVVEALRKAGVKVAVTLKTSADPKCHVRLINTDLREVDTILSN